MPGDAEVVRQVLEGDVNAFESLLVRYRVYVLRIVKRHVPQHDVEETAQDVFVKVYLSLSTFKGKGSFSRWIASIAVRTCYDYWRKAYRAREIPLSTLTERHRRWLEQRISDESDQSFNERSSQREDREVLDWALWHMSAADRTVLELVYLEGLSIREAADLLGWSTANVKVRSFRSRLKLEKLLRGLTEQGGKTA